MRECCRLAAEAAMAMNAALDRAVARNAFPVDERFVVETIAPAQAWCKCGEEVDMEKLRGHT